jgi:hypothetical protein
MGKKKSGNSNRQSNAANQASATADKTPRVRKPPMERAQILIKLAVVKLTALAKLSAGWEDESLGAGANPGVGVVSTRIAMNLRSALGMTAQIAADVGTLRDLGFAPKASALGRKGLAEGDLVKIKDAKFDVEMHGTYNHFKVVKTSEKNVLIEGAVDETIRFPVLRAWLESDKNTVAV